MALRPRAGVRRARPMRAAASFVRRRGESTPWSFSDARVEALRRRARLPQRWKKGSRALRNALQLRLQIDSRRRLVCLNC